MPRKCVVCNKLYTSGSDDSFHSFPKDEVRKKLWLNACKMRLHLPSHKICKDHFLPEHYLPSGYLKSNAIPFIETASKDTESSNSTSPATNLGVKPIVSTDTTGIEPADHTYYRTSSPCKNAIETLCIESIASTTTNIEPLDLCDNPSPIIQKRRRKINANTIGELSPSHFSSPENIKKHLDLVKSKFKEKQVENANLKKLIKRLKKKLTAYESVIR
ncbi:Hypothetical protein CINCED_3A014793 [Cinara cedri]|nr:Hypothetical protein CINCED_3A014793 [Cinara cedri]